MTNDGAIASLLEAARAAWPQIAVPDDVFAKELSARATRLGVAPDALATSDLYLAIACSLHDPAALSAFEASVLTEAARALVRLRVPGANADDLLQRVRTKLFVGDGDAKAPLVGTYSGKGALVAWVRAIVVHEALSEKRKDARRGAEDGASALDRIALSTNEPDLERLRRQYAEPFKIAFGDALGKLTARDRNVLRLVYVDGLTAEQVGLAYGVHRVSVARWLSQIRESLFDRTRAELVARLHVSEGELHSLTRMCLSQIDVSIERLLAGVDPQ